jgi:hypothetical protein
MVCLHSRYICTRFYTSSYSCKVNKGIKGSKQTVDVISGYLYIDLSIEDKRNLKIIEVISIKIRQIYKKVIYL